MENRVEITEVENGFTVRVWKESEEETDTSSMMYCEPETFVAATLDEALVLVKENFVMEKEGEE